MSQPQMDLNALWRWVIEQTKARTTTPALWRALEAAKPLTIEGEELILGFSVTDGHQAGLLADNRTRNTIEQVVESGVKRRLRLQIITGETLQDWEHYKASQAEAERLQAQSAQQFKKEIAAGDTWDQVSEQLVRKFNTIQHRSLASVQGRFLEEVIAGFAEAYGRLMPANPGELEERAFSRALERLAERVAVPSALIAHQVFARIQKS
jgi:uncharacterized lipoprotein